MSPSRLACVSPIWSSHIRDLATSSKMSSAELADTRSRNLVPGFVSEEFEADAQEGTSNFFSQDALRVKSYVPILLIQRPGSQEPAHKRLGKLFQSFLCIILSNIRPTETCYRYYKMESFHQRLLSIGI
jgi:endo-1,4-beta-D-glucanase Y